MSEVKGSLINYSSIALTWESVSSSGAVNINALDQTSWVSVLLSRQKYLIGIYYDLKHNNLSLGQGHDTHPQFKDNNNYCIKFPLSFHVPSGSVASVWVSLVIRTQHILLSYHKHLTCWQLVFLNFEFRKNKVIKICCHDLCGSKFWGHSDKKSYAQLTFMMKLKTTWNLVVHHLVISKCTIHSDLIFKWDYIVSFGMFNLENNN